MYHIRNLGICNIKEHILNFANNNYSILYFTKDQDIEDQTLSKYDPKVDYLNRDLFFEIKLI